MESGNQTDAAAGEMNERVDGIDSDRLSASVSLTLTQAREGRLYFLSSVTPDLLEDARETRILKSRITVL